MMCTSSIAYSGKIDFPELFEYNDNVNANLETALKSISSSFNENNVPVTQELLAAIMATLVKEVEVTGFLPKEEEGDYGMGPDSNYTVGGSRRSTPYEGGVDYKGRGYIQLTLKSNYEKYCPDCVAKESNVCGCEKQWECTVADEAICPQVKALQPERAAGIFASYYIESPSGKDLVSLSNAERYWEVAHAINPGEEYDSEFETYAKQYLTLFRNNPDKTNSLLAWLNSDTVEMGNVIASNDLSQGQSAAQNAVSNPLTTPIEAWNKTFDHVVLTSVQPTDNGYVAAGYTLYAEDALLIKVDSGGNEIWRKTFGGTEYDIAISVQLTSDGGYLLKGSSVSFNLPLATSGAAWLIKTDSAGNELWNRTFQGCLLGAFDSVQPTPDGGCAIAATCYYAVVDSRFDNNSLSLMDRDACLAKIDPTGDIVWSRSFDTFGMNGDDSVNSVKLANDGGYILSGRTGFSTGFGDDEWYFQWIMKTDSEGNEIWNKTLAKTERQYATNYQGVTFNRNTGWVQIGSFQFKEDGSYLNSLLPTTDGGYILVGNKIVDGTDWNDAWIAKIDSEGNEIWDKTFGGTGDDNALLIQPTQDGGYIVGGTTGYHENLYTIFEAWLVKTDSEGNEIWSKTFFTGKKAALVPS